MEYKNFDSFSSDEIGKCIHIKTKFENPNYNGVDKEFNEFISHFNKRFDIYLVKCKFEVRFINSHFFDFIETEFFQHIIR